MNLIKQGAEAKIYLEDTTIIKERIAKPYRLEAIDKRLRKSRTKREAKILQKLTEAGMAVPTLIEQKEFSLSMQYVDGDVLRDVLEEKEYQQICADLGMQIKKMHDLGIVHGDLTTSNLILKDGTLYFIDFGLSDFSEKIEDKAVDLHLLKQALESKHHTIFEEAFSCVLKGYADKDVEQRLEKVEGRGRYKGKQWKND